MLKNSVTQELWVREQF